MPKTVEYTGTQTRWSELATTGKQSTWMPGQAEERSDAEAVQLLGTGFFKTPDDTLTPSDIAGIKGVVSGAGNSAVGVVLIGGDHPYAQWAGQARLYADNGLRPYLAVNSGAAGISPGDTDMLNYQQLATLGVELASHGVRHVQDWTRLNTGIRLSYTGANGTATATVSATQLTLTDSGSTVLTLASYTLSQLAAVVNVVSGWSMAIAPELTGDEQAACLLQIAATSCKNVTQRFAAGGGVSILYAGTAFFEVFVRILANTLKVYCDGIAKASVSLSGGATLASVVSAINGAGVSGLTAKLCDNQKGETPAFESYVSGSELAVSLYSAGGGMLPCIASPAIIDAGLPQWYMMERQIAGCVAAMTASGAPPVTFASSGENCIPRLAAQHRLVPVTRGNAGRNVDTAAYRGLPVAVPTQFAGFFRPVCGLTAATYTSGAEIQAIWRALAVSPGFTVDALMHKVLADGSSTYSFPTTDVGYYDQTESVWVPAVQALGALVRSGAIRNAAPSEMPRMAASALPPPNSVFNSTFENSGESLQFATLNSVAVPGWGVLTAPANYSAVSMAGGVATFTMATASEVTPVRQIVYLERGKTYEIGCYVEQPNYTSGNGVSIQLNPIYGRQWLGWDQQQTNVNRSRYAAGKAEWLSMRFTVPAAPALGGNRIIGVSFGAGVDMTTNKNISLNIMSKGAIDIDCSAGAASAASVQAFEAAAAINAALKAAAGYRAFSELHQVARAEGGKVFIELPRRSPDASFLAVLAAGSTASITTTIFGASDGICVGLPYSQDNYAMDAQVSFAVAAAIGSVVKISSPRIYEVTL